LPFFSPIGRGISGVGSAKGRTVIGTSWWSGDGRPTLRIRHCLHVLVEVCAYRERGVALHVGGTVDEVGKRVYVLFERTGRTSLA